MAPARSRSRPSSDAAVPLPYDAVYEVLLRVPGRDLCRFRAVCRPWRRLLSDPHFIAAHAARNTEPPLFVAGYDTGLRDDGVICDIVDLSGKVVRRVRAAGDAWVTSVNLDLVCFSKGNSRCIRFFNMTTGDAFALPEGLSKEHVEGRDILDYRFVDSLGHVASTGQYKVLRVLKCPSNDNHQLCEVFTLDGSSHAWWRGKKAPPRPVSTCLYENVHPVRQAAIITNTVAAVVNTVAAAKEITANTVAAAKQLLQSSEANRVVVVDSIVYFIDQANWFEEIASFDLETEEWRSALRGPHYQQPRAIEVSMADMNGSLDNTQFSSFAYAKERQRFCMPC
ncbi:hypothetical protein EJB05_51169, partial [Eragrostis curvula]